MDARSSWPTCSGTPSLHGAHLVLEDIDPAPLVKMEALARRLDEALGAGTTVATTTDQRRSLEGADFVIVTISTGGFESMAVDLDVPARYGIRQSVGDTVGPGGVNRSLRNVPVLVGIAEDMAELCPDAWLLNITNPMTCLTRAVCRETGVRAVGLCHEVGNWSLDLAIALGKPAEAVEATVAGVNHFPVVTALDVDGRGRVRRPARDGGGGRRARRPRPAPGPARGAGVLAARLLPAPHPGPHTSSSGGARCPPPATGTWPSSSPGCSPRRRGGAGATTSN